MMTERNPWAWDAGAALGGLLGAAACVALVESIGHAMLTGTAAFVPPIIGYGLGAALAALIAGQIAARPVAVAIALTGVLAALAAFNLFALPHPIWFAPVAAVALAGGCALGLAFRKTPSRSA